MEIWIIRHQTRDTARSGTLEEAKSVSSKELIQDKECQEEVGVQTILCSLKLVSTQTTNSIETFSWTIKHLLIFLTSNKMIDRSNLKSVI